MAPNASTARHSLVRIGTGRGIDSTRRHHAAPSAGRGPQASGRGDASDDRAVWRRAASWVIHMKHPTLGLGSSGSIRIDVDALIASRALLCAQSGSGKSWALRRILEQTHGRVQQLVVDPEGELFTLRERYDYVLVGRGGDCVADPKSAGLLARRLLELGTSAILDISELRPADREALVAGFCQSLVSAPRALWHPVLVVIDEAHQFCPERGKRAGPRGPCADSVIDLMALGRKRGFAALLATQRLSKLSKDAAAEAGNVLVGRATLPLDARSMADLLGSGSEGQAALKRLRPGQFFALGPAISDEVVRVDVGSVETTHPRAGKVAPPPAPPRAKVQAALRELAGIAEAEAAEEREVETLRALVAELQREARAARRPGPSDEDLARARAEGAAAARRELSRAVSDLAGRQLDAASALDRAMGELAKVSDLVRAPIDAEISEESPAVRAVTAPPAPVPRPVPRPPASGSPCDLPRGERVTLIAIAQHAEGVDRPQLTILTGYKRSTRDAYLQRMRAAGLIEERGGRIHAADAGIGALGSDYEPLPTGAELREHWLGRLPAGESAILRILIDAYPAAVARQAISDATGYARSSRDAYIQRLAGRKLVDAGRGAVTASAGMFV